MQMSAPDKPNQSSMFELEANTLGDGAVKTDLPAKETTENPPSNSLTNATKSAMAAEAEKLNSQAEPAKEVVTPVVEAIKEVPVVQTEQVVEETLDAETKAYIESLEPEKAVNEKTEAAGKETKIATAKREIDPELQSKLKAYEDTLNDPYTKAVAEWRKKGGVDFNEFQKEVGLVNPATLSVSDLITIQAKAAGFEGEELEAAVTEQVEKFNGQTLLEKKTIENELRNKVKAEQAERLTAFATATRTQLAEQQSAMQEAIQTANKNLDEGVNQLVGKKWKGLPITEELGKAIREIASDYARPILNEKGQTIGFETADAIEFAIWKASGNGKQLLKANIEIGKTIGMEKTIKERNRVTDNDTPAAIVAKGYSEEVDSAIKDMANNKNGNKMSLSAGATKK